MHPVIKLVSLIILSIFSTQGGWNSLALSCIIILPFYFFYPNLWHSAIKMTLKLKWLFLSIMLVFYILSPEIESFLLGLFRVLVLIVIIFSVNLYLKTSSIEQILASLLWLFHPLNYLAVNVERLALRAVLTLEYIDDISQRIENYKNSLQPDPADIISEKNSFFINRKKSLLQLVNQFDHIFQDILSDKALNHSDEKSFKKYTIDCLAPPAFLQLLIPALLMMLYLLNIKIL